MSHGSVLPLRGVVRIHSAHPLHLYSSLWNPFPCRDSAHTPFFLAGPHAGPGKVKPYVRSTNTIPIPGVTGIGGQVDMVRKAAFVDAMLRNIPGNGVTKSKGL